MAARSRAKIFYRARQPSKVSGTHDGNDEHGQTPQELRMKQVQDAYIVAATRTPVGKAPRGMFRNTRPDDLLVHALKSALAQTPGLDPGAVEDVIVGCAIPEAEQGMNVA